MKQQNSFIHEAVRYIRLKQCFANFAGFGIFLLDPFLTVRLRLTWKAKALRFDLLPNLQDAIFFFIIRVYIYIYVHSYIHCSKFKKIEDSRDINWILFGRLRQKGPDQGKDRKEKNPNQKRSIGKTNQYNIIYNKINY